MVFPQEETRFAFRFNLIVAACDGVRYIMSGYREETTFFL